jgi:hypothetical protein
MEEYYKARSLVESGRRIDAIRYLRQHGLTLEIAVAITRRLADEQKARELLFQGEE